MSKKKRPDMKNPKIRAMVSHFHLVVATALNETLEIEKSVCPIYCTLENRKKLEQIGSGVFVCIKHEYFVFSASHVFDDIGELQLMMGVEGEEKLVAFGGERFSSFRGPSGTHRDDPIDASVFHIQTKVPETVKKLALSLDDLDAEPYDKTQSAFVVSGIRSKQSQTRGNQSFTKRESYGSFELYNDDYISLGMTKEPHLLLAYDDEIWVKEGWQKSPKPAGFSGGGIFRIRGLSTSSLFLETPKLTPLLSAITIGHRREKGNKPGVLIGTRIFVHLGLINKFLPGLI